MSDTASQKAESPERIRVLVVDDEQSVRDAVCDLITNEADMEVVGAAPGAEEAMVLARQSRPDVAILDVKMLGGGSARRRKNRVRVAGDEGRCALGVRGPRQRPGDASKRCRGLLGQRDGAERDRRGDPTGGPRPGPVLSADVTGAVIEALFQDIDERRQSEDVLRRSEGRFRGLLESAPDGVVIVDATGRIVLVNQQTEEMFAYERRRAAGRARLKCCCRNCSASDTLTIAAHTSLTRARGRWASGSSLPVGARTAASFRSTSPSARSRPKVGVLATAFVRDHPRAPKRRGAPRQKRASALPRCSSRPRTPW